MRQTSTAVEKKNHYNKSQKGIKCTSVDDDDEQLIGRQRKVQKCRKCMNHDKFDSIMRSHKKICPHNNCTCEKCKSTLDRRLSVRCEAKSKREKEKIKDQVQEPLIKSEVIEMPMEIAEIQIEDVNMLLGSDIDYYATHYYYSSSSESYDSGVSSPTPSTSSDESEPCNNSIFNILTNLTQNIIFDDKLDHDMEVSDFGESLILSTNKLSALPEIDI